MKRLTTLILAFAFSTICLMGCSPIMESKVINKEYIPAYSGVETEYVYKYDWLNGEYKYVPEVKTVYHQEEYRLHIEHKHENGKTSSEWKSVNQDTYEKYNIGDEYK